MTKSLAVALPLLLLILTVLDVKASTQINRSKWPNISSKLLTHGLKVSTLPFVSVRGGALDGSDDDELDLDDEDEEPEEEEEIEEEELDPVMVKAAIKASHKSKQKQTAAVKAKVSATLATPVTKKKKSNGIIKKIPYIIRACLNPFTVIAMTKAYFASLFNLNYLQEVRFCCIFNAFCVVFMHVQSNRVFIVYGSKLMICLHLKG